MSDTDGATPDSSRAFLEHLEGSGFFEQIGDLEKNLQSIASELKNFGETAARRMEETENLAAHVLAIESVLGVMLRTYPVEAEALKAEVVERTAAISGKPDGSPAVHAIAQDILGAAKT